MKKRILSLLLVFVLAASLLPCAAFAEGEGESTDLTYAMSASGNLYAGGTVKVEISLTANPGIAGFEALVDYNSDLLTLDSASLASGVPGDLGVNKGTGKLLWVAGMPVEGEEFAMPEHYTGESFIVLSFTVADTVEEGVTTTVGLKDGYIFASYPDTNDPEFAVTSTGAGCSIEFDAVPYEPGDLDGNDKVNMKDLALMRSYLLDSNTEVVSQAADLDGNGKINMKDLALLRTLLLS